MLNELDLIKALEDVAKSFGYNMIYFEADKCDGVMARFAEPNYVELHANGEVIYKEEKSEKTPTNDEGEVGICDRCKYYTTKLYDEPCLSCGKTYINFERKSEE